MHEFSSSDIVVSVIGIVINWQTVPFDNEFFCL